MCDYFGCTEKVWSKKHDLCEKHYKMLINLYHSILDRCYNINCKSYPNYGGRGISMFSEWIDNFSIFKKWINENLGPKPTPDHSLDRIDNDGNYEPGNLKWSTKQEQSLNTRVSGKAIGNTEKTKRCSKCKKIKLRSEFHKDSHQPDGLEYRCKMCRKT